MSRAGFMSLVALLGVAVLALILWKRWPHVFPDVEWADQMQSRIMALRAKRPAEFSQEHWDFLIDWTLNLHANYGDSRLWTDQGRRWLILKEFDQRLDGPVDAATIDWVWDEFARHTTGGQSYSDRFRPTRSPELKLFQK